MPVRTDHEARPAPCTTGTGPLQGIKRPIRGTDHPGPSGAKNANGLEPYLHLLSYPAQACHVVPLDVTQPNSVTLKIEATRSVKRSEQNYATMYKNPKEYSLNNTGLQNLKTYNTPASCKITRVCSRM